MKLEIKIKPLSVNGAWQGRRFKSKSYKEFEDDIVKILPRGKYPDTKEELVVYYRFYIKNYGGSDAANFEKVLTDILVKRNYLKDDRYIKMTICEKFKVSDAKEERIEAFISKYKDIYTSALEKMVQ